MSWQWEHIPTLISVLLVGTPIPDEEHNQFTTLIYNNLTKTNYGMILIIIQQ